MTARQNTEIQDFYNDCGVFVTGGTGFLGKLTIEKILRSCPGVRRVYVLIRSKKGLSVDERKKFLLDNVVFERMKCEQPDSVDKIVIVPGDCSVPRLGLSDSDYHDLTQHVNIVLHLAANVRFDENLKVAVTINTKGTREAIKLCRDCISLKAAVFVSTAYSNCIHDVVKEEFYDPPFPLEDLLVLLDRLTPYESDILLPKIIGSCPNAYIFTKAMSENAILVEAQGIPSSVVRPSIIVPTLREPVRGWLDNMYGPISIVFAVGVGILRVSYSEEKNLFDIVPADIVANCVIAAAYSSSKRSGNEGITIYNSTISDNNPLTLKEFKQTILERPKDIQLKECIWHPFMIEVTNYKIYMLLAFFLHFLPGCLLDLGLRLKKRPPKFLKMYRKIQNHALQTGYFSKRNIMFCASNTRNMLNQLDVTDQEMFSDDTTLINWRQFILRSCKEARKYVLSGTLHGIEDNSSRPLKSHGAQSSSRQLENEEELTESSDGEVTGSSDAAPSPSSTVLAPRSFLNKSPYIQISQRLRSSVISHQPSQKASSDVHQQGSTKRKSPPATGETNSKKRRSGPRSTANNPQHKKKHPKHKTKTMGVISRSKLQETRSIHYNLRKTVKKNYR